MVDLNDIRLRALQVATLDGARRKAIDEEQEAGAKLLDAVIEAAKPALEAVSRKLPKCDADYFETATDVYPMVGLRLDGNERPKPLVPGQPVQPPHTLANKTALYLLEGGVLVTLHWPAELGKKVHATLVSTRQALEWGARPGACIRAISDALDQQLNGNAEKNTVLAMRRRAKYEAILTLLDK